jgi:hypothetical protein
MALHNGEIVNVDFAPILLELVQLISSEATNDFIVIH